MMYFKILFILLINCFLTGITFAQEDINNCLADIDKIVINGIKEKAMPGCRVLVIKDNVAVYNKSFGFFGYDSIKPVNDSSIYDLASITKVAATTLAIMKLYEQNKIDINKTLSDYLEIAKGTNKEDIKIKDILTHSAGLKAWIPFYLDSNNKINNQLFSNDSSMMFNIKIANDFWGVIDMKTYILNKIINSPVNNEKKYLYSDMGMYLLKEIIENVSAMKFEDYLNKEFFQPLKLNNILFNPYKNIPLDNVAQTENDMTFRKQIIKGYVNDQGAAMLGGISGHAGLFSDANSLAVIFQMLLNYGEYNGVRLLQRETIEKFTSYQQKELGNRRGLGFDKPLLRYNSNSHTSQYVSADSYGHSGFTGTFVWADPKHKIIYIFLSNRTFPDAENKKINSLNIRTDIQDVIYKCLTK